MEDLDCLICFGMLREPITMRCGHSFCRECSIKWHVTYRKTSCPVCRKILDKELPSVNITLKAVIENVRLKIYDKMLVEFESKELLLDCNKIEISEKFINQNRIELKELVIMKRDLIEKETKNGRQRLRKESSKTDKDGFFKFIFMTGLNVFLLIFLRILKRFVN